MSAPHRTAARRGAAAAFVLLLGAVTAPACGTDAPTDAAAPIGRTVSAADPCSLLTVGDIHRATGWVVPAGHRSTPAATGWSVCSWQGPAQDGVVQVQIATAGGTSAYDARRAELAAASPDVTTVDVPGAIRADQSPATGVVDLLIGDDVVQVSALGGSLDGREHLELAAAAAARLAS